MGRINVAYAIFEGPSGPNNERRQRLGREDAHIDVSANATVIVFLLSREALTKSTALHMLLSPVAARKATGILAEGAIALSVTLSGGELCLRAPRA